MVSNVDSYGAAPESDSEREVELTDDFEAAAAELSEDGATIDNFNDDDSSEKEMDDMFDWLVFGEDPNDMLAEAVLGEDPNGMLAEAVLREDPMTRLRRQFLERIQITQLRRSQCYIIKVLLGCIGQLDLESMNHHVIRWMKNLHH